VLDAPDRYAELRKWLAEQWRRGETDWSPEAAAIFAELELDPAVNGRNEWRSPLESPRFRALLDESEAALPAAA
jgi:hypothetical protein